jgi:hypothetical protein
MRGERRAEPGHGCNQYTGMMDTIDWGAGVAEEPGADPDGRGMDE